MTPTGHRDLPGFEQRLLDELTHHLTTRATTPTAAPAPPWSRRRGLIVAAAALTGATAAVAVPVLLSGPGGAPPAFALTEHDDGTVEIEVHDPRGAEDLQQALAEHGVTAVVDVLPSGQTCAEPRFDHAPAGHITVEMATHEQPDGTRTETHRFTLDPAHFDADTTLVLTVSAPWAEDGGDDGAAMLQVAVAAGEVAACTPVPLQIPDPVGEDTNQPDTNQHGADATG